MLDLISLNFELPYSQALVKYGKSFLNLTDKLNLVTIV